MQTLCVQNNTAVFPTVEYTCNHLDNKLMSGSVEYSRIFLMQEGTVTFSSIKSFQKIKHEKVVMKEMQHSKRIFFDLVSLNINKHLTNF